MNDFPFYQQSGLKDCGPTCLRMICKYYGKDLSIDYLTQLCNIYEDGTSMYNLQQAATKLRFESYGIKTTFEGLFTSVTLPCILHLSMDHYVVLVPGSTPDRIHVADPGMTRVEEMPVEIFRRRWAKGEEEGYVLVIESKEHEKDHTPKTFSWKKLRFYIRYLAPHKFKLAQLSVLFIASGLIAYAIPFVVKGVMDKGIKERSIDAVGIFVIAQFALYMGTAVIELAKGWLMLFINNNFIISLLRDFLSKVANLPIAYFQVQRLGEINQRLQDHHRIQYFILNNFSTLIVSTITFLAFFAALISFSGIILLLLLVFSVLNIIWMQYSLKRRRELDYAGFHSQSDNQDKLYEMIAGLQDLKLHNGEQQSLNTWARSQEQIFEISRSGYKLSQQQSIGAALLNNLENVLISFISAYEVIKGHMSLGAMVSINMVAVQFKSSIMNYSGLIRSFQDAKISLERIADIQDMQEEDGHGPSADISATKIKSISFRNVGFIYPGTNNKVLQDITMTCRAGETIAIVGTNGSGKTTLFKLLLKYYRPDTGDIIINNTISLEDISAKAWRNKCGIVMQEGYLFSSSIKNNIIINAEDANEARLQEVAAIAGLRDWVSTLPHGWDTQVGAKGVTISGGQKQRILIARALYLNKDILLLDEATSALDAESEMQISNNIHDAFRDKIKMVIAHRFNTILNADKIIVMKHGEIVQMGTHAELFEQEGQYATLFVSQARLYE